VSSPATITLTESMSETLSIGEQSSWPVNVTALGAGMPSEIFIFQIVPANDYLPGDRYQCVASVSQLQELPIVSGIRDKDREGEQESPRRSSRSQFDIPYYRASFLEIVCHSAGEAQELWTRLQDEVQRLVDNYNQWQTMQTVDTVVISPEAYD
jgi:hypothetical protein